MKTFGEEMVFFFDSGGSFSPKFYPRGHGKGVPSDLALIQDEFRPHNGNYTIAHFRTRRVGFLNSTFFVGTYLPNVFYTICIVYILSSTYT